MGNWVRVTDKLGKMRYDLEEWLENRIGGREIGEKGLFEARILNDNN